MPKAVVVGKTAGINHRCAKIHEAAFETLGLGYATQGGNLPPSQQCKIVPFAGKDVLQIEWMMNTLNNAGTGIVLRDAPPQFRRSPKGVK